MICKAEYVGTHLFQVSLERNVIRALAFNFRMGGTTVGRIVKKTVEVLWEELHPLHTSLPTTESLKKKTVQMNLKMSGTFLMSLVVWMANIFV